MVNCKIEKKYLFPAVYKLVKTFFGESTPRSGTAFRGSDGHLRGAWGCDPREVYLGCTGATLTHGGMRDACFCGRILINTSVLVSMGSCPQPIHISNNSHPALPTLLLRAFNFLYVQRPPIIAFIQHSSSLHIAPT